MKKEDVKCYQIEQTLSKDDFLRTIIVGLGTSTETPSDVFTGKFENITCEKQNFVSTEGSASVRYSASVGYDYQEEDFQYDHINKKYNKVMVTKTNWSPYQSTYHSDQTVGFCENRANPDSKEAIAFRKLLKNIEPQGKCEIDNPTDKSVIAKEFEDVSEEIIKLSVEDMKTDAIQQCKKSLPGDRYKDFSAQVDVQLTGAAMYSVPCHSLKLKYKGNEYDMRAFAHGTCNVRGNIPKAEEKKSSIIGIVKAVSLLTSLLLMIFAIFHLNPVLAWIMAVVATVAFVSYKFLETYSKKVFNHKKVLSKMNSVIQILAANQLSPLSEEEKQKFNVVYKKGHKSKLTYSEAFAWVFYIISIILFFINYNDIGLINIILILAFVGIPAIIIYGLIIAPLKKKK